MSSTTTAIYPSTFINRSKVEENQIPFEIQTLEWSRQQSCERHEMPHRHQHFEIIWIRKGSGNLDIDLKRYKMGNNMLYCIIPGQLHQLEIDEHAEGFIISFPESILNSGHDNFELVYRSGLFHLLLHSPGMRLEQETASEVEDIIKKLYRELYNISLLRTEIITRYISIFLIYVARQFEGLLQVSAQTKNVRLVKNFISLVEEKYTIWRLVKDYAEELSISPNYLNEIVKKVTGCPAGYHIRQRIVLEARRKATYSDASMKEVAYYLGFDDLAHFSKFFKTVYGKSFTEFKKENCYNIC